jgi:hypothetical protein
MDSCTDYFIRWLYKEENGKKFIKLFVIELNT